MLSESFVINIMIRRKNLEFYLSYIRNQLPFNKVLLIQMDSNNKIIGKDYE